jgi:hypothetical protein
MHFMKYIGDYRRAARTRTMAASNPHGENKEGGARGKAHAADHTLELEASPIKPTIKRKKSIASLTSNGNAASRNPAGGNLREVEIRTLRQRSSSTPILHEVAAPPSSLTFRF